MFPTVRIASARPSAALVVAVMALVSSLTGTAFAAGVLPTNSVDTKQVKPWAITTPKLANAAVTARKLGTGSVTSAKVLDRSLRAIDFAPGQLPAGTKGAAGAVGPAGSVGPVGPAGPAGSAVAYARVSGGASPTISPGSAKGIAAVARAAVGTYCVTPAAGISPASHPAVVSVEPGGALLPVGLASVKAADSTSACAVGTLQVETYRIYVEANGGPMLADDVPFSIIVA